MSNQDRSGRDTSEIMQRSNKGKENTLQGIQFDDLFVQNIVLNLDKVIRKERRRQQTKTAMKYKSIYYKVYYIKYIALYVYMLMVLFEQPSWCLNDPHIKNLSTCDNHIYPNSKVPKLPHQASRAIEIL